MRLSLRIRDLVMASWRIERAQAQALLPPSLEPTTVDGDHLISVVGLRYEPSGVVRAFAQLNVRTYVLYQGKPAVYFLLSRVTLPGLPATLLGFPYRLARISVERGRLEAPGLGVSLRYRIGEAVNPGPIGMFELGLFGRGQLRKIRIHRSPTEWRGAELEGHVRADPILAHGVELAETPALVYAERTEFELDTRRE